MSVFSSLVKERVSVSRVRDIQAAVHAALHAAAAATPGPVLLELPVDVLYPYQTGTSPVPDRYSARRVWGY